MSRPVQQSSDFLVSGDYRGMRMPVAVAFGVTEALLLQQLNFWLEHPPHVFEGRRWVYNTLTDWHENFPCFSRDTIRRSLAKLRDQDKVVIAKTFPGEGAGHSRTLWYTIDFERLDKAIADTADEYGGSHMPMSKMMKWTRATEGEVLDLLGVLESHGEIIVEGQASRGYVCLIPRFGARLVRSSRRNPRAGADAARRRLIAERGERCEECGNEGRVDAHHVVPLKHGGSNDESNLRLLCKACYKAAHLGGTRA